MKCRNFTILKDVLHQGSVDLTSEQQQQFAIGRTLVTRPCLLLLGLPTAGIQPSIIQDVGRAIFTILVISQLFSLNNFLNLLAILLVVFLCWSVARWLSLVKKKDINETDVRRYFTL